MGCGYGWYTDYFSSIGGKALGCDGSQKMIDIAKSKYPHCDFQIADMESTLPYKDSCFDIVFCNQVLMDIENYGKAMSEAYRVLKKDGVFFFGIVHPAFYDCEWTEDENGFKNAKVIERYLSQYSFQNEYWGSTTHYHRTLSDYINTAIETGFSLKKLTEPVSYDGVNKSQELPLFLFAEFKKKFTEKWLQRSNQTMTFYHGSPIGDLTELQPFLSEHGKPYVYFSTNPLVALLYAVKPVPKPFSFYPYGFDKQGNVVYSEYFENAFYALYKNKRGYLYECDDLPNTDNQTSINSAVTCTEPIKVSRVTEIPDLYEYFINAQKSGTFRIKPKNEISEKEMCYILGELKKEYYKHGIENQPNHPMHIFLAKHFPTVVREIK